MSRLHLDLDNVFETLRRGVWRADIFMGIGLNAAEQDPPPSHILAPETGFAIHLVKQNLTKPETAHVATEFGKWVRANGLRELLETFSSFMHKLYTVNFYIIRSCGRLDNLSRMSPLHFEKLSIHEQLKTLSKVIAVPADDLRVIETLKQARNCYAHRHGVVSDIDTNAETSVFELLWTTFQLEIAEPDGNIVTTPDIYGRVFENGGTVQLRVTMRSRLFGQGEELILSKQELKEICFCVFLIGQRLFKETVDFAKKEGVLVEKLSGDLNNPKPV